MRDERSMMSDAVVLNQISNEIPACSSFLVLFFLNFWNAFRADSFLKKSSFHVYDDSSPNSRKVAAEHMSQISEKCPPCDINFVRCWLLEEFLICFFSFYSDIYFHTFINFFIFGGKMFVYPIVEKEYFLAVFYAILKVFWQVFRRCFWRTPLHRIVVTIVFCNLGTVSRATRSWWYYWRMKGPV